MIPISNAKDFPITIGTLPDPSGALFSYFQPLTLKVLTKSLVNFQNVEVAVATNTMGVIQPLTAQQLNMKPEGQRAWIWQNLYCLPGLVLKPDDVVIFQGTQYRVMNKTDYSQFGFLNYHLVQDFTGSGP
jgi:hypothetical protein